MVMVVVVLVQYCSCGILLLSAVAAADVCTLAFFHLLPANGGLSSVSTIYLPAQAFHSSVLQEKRRQRRGDNSPAGSLLLLWQPNLRYGVANLICISVASSAAAWLA